MSHYKQQEDFETQDDLEADVELAQQDYAELIKVTGLFASLPVRATIALNQINHDDVKLEAAQLIEQIEGDLNKLHLLQAMACKATTRIWEEPENSGEHSTMNKIGTGCRS